MTPASAGPPERAPAPGAGGGDFVISVEEIEDALVDGDSPLPPAGQSAPTVTAAT